VSERSKLPAPRAMPRASTTGRAISRAPNRAMVMPGGFTERRVCGDVVPAGIVRRISAMPRLTGAVGIPAAVG
jgi:hypothetical protein